MLIPIDRPMIDARNIRQAATQTVAAGFVAKQVLKKCGKPTAKTDYETVWVYDRGPSYFIYYIKFSSGNVLRIQSGKYGK